MDFFFALLFNSVNIQINLFSHDFFASLFHHQKFLKYSLWWNFFCQFMCHNMGKLKWDGIFVDVQHKAESVKVCFTSKAY